MSHRELPQVLIRKPTPPDELLPSAPTSEVPGELLASAGRRLGYTALIYAAAYALLNAIGHVAMALDATPMTNSMANAMDRIAFIFILLSLATWAIARSGWLRPAVLLDAALVYMVVGAVGIDIGMLFAPRDMPLEMASMLSWTVVWLVMFPMLVPTSPGKTLVAALIAASAKPLFVLVLAARGWPTPSAGTLLEIAVPNYIGAFIALIGSHVIYGLNREVSRAQRMGSYRLIERLGTGGMGEVWRAEHRLLAMPAAIKVIRPDALGSDADSRRQLMKRFEREARATAVLTSPHTVQLYDYGVTDQGAFYYVMELLEGLDADALVQRFGPLPPARAVHVLRQVCDSLAEAHRASLVHRDIKPANVFLCRRGLAYDFVKVLDFGLVKTVGAAGQAASTVLTGQHVAAGTPAFMSPESALGESDVDARADIYAVGCLAYWLLTGTFVFEGTGMQVALAHVGTAPRRPSERVARPIPPELDDLVMACLAKDRDHRPPSAEQVAVMLARLPLADRWDSESAVAWWHTHLPELAAPVGTTAPPSPATAGVARTSAAGVA